jgi:hypothetical protein
MSVEGIWEGLKVFENADVDPSKFGTTDMKGVKRSSRTLGQVLGHRDGVCGARLMDYRQARRRIYVPSYRWVLENRLAILVQELRSLGQNAEVILLDYETQEHLNDLSRPLSHAGLVIRWVEGTWLGQRNAGI